MMTFLPFNAHVYWSVKCNVCGLVADAGSASISASGTVFMPSLPEKWINAGDFGVLCPQHKMRIEDKGNP